MIAPGLAGSILSTFSSSMTFSSAVFSVVFSSVISLIAGFIEFLAKELGGYGWALIGLGVITRLAMAPLYQAQMRQMEKMKKIKPLLDKLQEKYKDDEQELAKRTMELFRQHNVNPFSGCLVAILQIPILIAIYRAIYANLEMFDGKGFLWITNLAKPDLLLFAVYVLSMYLSMELTPTAGISEEERKRMRTMNLMMLLFLSILLYNFASAFILYWLSYNVVSLLHTMLLFKEETRAA